MPINPRDVDRLLLTYVQSTNYKSIFTLEKWLTAVIYVFLIWIVHSWPIQQWEAQHRSNQTPFAVLNLYTYCIWLWTLKPMENNQITWSDHSIGPRCCCCCHPGSVHRFYRPLTGMFQVVWWPHQKEAVPESSVFQCTEQDQPIAATNEQVRRERGRSASMC